jgi:hypothetical protein
MAYTRKRLPNGIVETTVSGEIGVSESKASVKDLASFVIDGTLYECVIHSDDANIEVSYDQGSSVVSEASALFNSLRSGAIAFVAESPLVFGLCRQLQMRLDNNLVHLAVFKKRETALLWLEEMGAGLFNP